MLLTSFRPCAALSRGHIHLLGAWGWLWCSPCLRGGHEGSWAGGCSSPLLRGGVACRSPHLAPSLAEEHVPSATATQAAPKRSHKGREVLVPLTTPLGTFLGPWWHLRGAYLVRAVLPELAGSPWVPLGTPVPPEPTGAPGPQRQLHPRSPPPRRERLSLWHRKVYCASPLQRGNGNMHLFVAQTERKSPKSTLFG